MHVALVANTAWLDEELDFFRRLVVGLMDQNIRVTQVIPDALPEEEVSSFAARLTWRDTPWKLLRRHRLRQLAPALEALDVTIIHALDGQTWAGAMDIARAMEGSVVLTCASAGDLDELSHTLRVAGDLRLGVAPTTEPIGQEARNVASAQYPIRVAAIGIHPAEETVATTEADPDALCAVISGSARLDADYRALFRALTEIVKAHPASQFFLDTQGHDAHTLWKEARSLGLLGHISLAPRRLGHRELLLRADLLIHPQAMGHSRGLTIRAMSRGLPVIARADPLLDYLIQDQTATLIDEATPNAWLDALGKMWSDPEGVRKLAMRGQAYVTEKCLASSQVDQIVQLYRTVTGEAYRFPPPPARSKG